MTELWLNFTDEDGYPERVLVGRDIFTIGRHSDNDLFVPNDKLSRQHLKIEKSDDKFIVSDSNSSNGTRLNYDELFEPAVLYDGDVLNLGGGLEIRVEIVSVRAEEESFSPAAEAPAPKAAVNRPSATVQSVPETFGGVSSNFFFIAPILGLLGLVLVGGLFFAFRGDSNDNPNNEIADTNEREERNNTRENRRTPSNEKTPSSSPANNSSTTPTPANNSTSVTPTPIVSNEIEKIKSNAKEFMRRIAQNDADPFLTNAQAEKVNQKIKNFKNSSGLAENLRAVLRDKSQFETLAGSKGLKPQFLAAAALNEIGNRSGNPSENAKAMVSILFNLKTPLGDGFADDVLLIVAAYDQGKRGDFKTMQGRLEGLSKNLSKNKESVSTREMRKIWFLKERGKLTDAEFEYAVNFLAIGVIMQSPKDFGVNADAVVF